MKITAFTDIHSNLAALRTLMSAMEKEKPDRVIFTGDILSKGDKPRECTDLLMDSGYICLAGNCDLYYTRGVDIDPDVLQYREQYKAFGKKLSRDEQSFFDNMPIEYVVEDNGYRLHFAHFLIKDINAPYPYLGLSSLCDGSFDAAAESSPYDIEVIGHSHRAFEKGRVLSLSSAGLCVPNYAVIETDGELKYRVVTL